MKKIAVGLDGSKNAFKALEEGIRLALFYHAKLYTVSVEEIPRFPETIGEVQEEISFEDSRYHKIIEDATKMANERNCQIESHILVGHEVKMILEFVKEYEIDLLIVGMIGVSAIYERMMGSTSASLVRMCHCSVLVIK